MDERRLEELIASIDFELPAPLTDGERADFDARTTGRKLQGVAGGILTAAP
ncbi:MAG TPA: hypothetical protein VGD78_21060 [Chthoniobacterales bacterium]